MKHLIIILAVLASFSSNLQATSKKKDPKQAAEKQKKPAAKIPKSILADPNWIMLDHVEAVFKLLKANRGKCDKTLRKALLYVKQHKIELLALRKKAQELKSSLCPKARKRADAIILSRAEKLGAKYNSIMFDYYKKCPEQSERLVSDVMRFLGSKCSEDH